MDLFDFDEYGLSEKAKNALILNNINSNSEFLEANVKKLYYTEKGFNQTIKELLSFQSILEQKRNKIEKKIKTESIDENEQNEDIVSISIEELINKKGLPQKKQDIIHELVGKFSEEKITVALSNETNFINIGNQYYDKLETWKERSCAELTKQLPHHATQFVQHFLRINKNSFTLVLVFLFILKMDERGSVDLTELKNLFYNFYLTHHNKKLIAKANADEIIQIRTLTKSEFERLNTEAPLNHFLLSDFFQNSLRMKRIHLKYTFSNEFSNKLVRHKTLIIFLKTIDDYFQGIRQEHTSLVRKKQRSFKARKVDQLKFQENSSNEVLSGNQNFIANFQTEKRLFELAADESGLDSKERESMKYDPQKKTTGYLTPKKYDSVSDTDEILYVKPTVTKVSYDLLEQIILLLKDCDNIPKTTFVKNNHKRLKVSVTFLTRLIDDLISSEIIDYSNGMLNLLTSDQLEIRLSHFLKIKKMTKSNSIQLQPSLSNDSSTLVNSDAEFRKKYIILKAKLKRIPNSSEMKKYSPNSWYQRMIFKYGDYYKFVLKMEKTNHNNLIENYTRLKKKYDYLPIPDIFDQYSTYPTWLYQKCFGSFFYRLNEFEGQQEKLNNNNLNKIIGKTRNNELETLLNIIYHQLRDKLNRIPKITELEKNAGVKFHQVFNKYNGYVGYIFNQERLDVNMLLDEYRLLGEKYGFEDAYNVIDKHGNYPAWMYSRSCGNLGKFVKIAKSGKKVTLIRNRRPAKKSKNTGLAFRNTKQKKTKHNSTISSGNKRSSSIHHVNNLLNSILD
jgi:hypothetical protein